MNPWEVLGLSEAEATPAGVGVAKRRLAKVHHPDVVAGGGGGTDAVAEASTRLALVNQAAQLALAELSNRRPAPGPSVATGSPLEQDEAEATFSVESLPVEAFELLLLAFSAIGDPKVVDEPYLLEGQVDDPTLGVARIELAPEAGGSLVTVTTWAARRGTLPPPTAVQVAGRLLWEVGNLGGA